MTTLQRFKENDAIETKMIAVAMPTLDALGAEHDALWAGAFECYLLGDVLFDTGRSPMAGVITREVFRTSFFAIHELFTRPGTFEFYLAVFRSVWGPDVEIEFTIPSPGVLEINADVLNVMSVNFAAREIVDDVYYYNPIIDEAGDFIMFQDSVGIKTQTEVDALMNEIKPEGVFVVTTLII